MCPIARGDEYKVVERKVIYCPRCAIEIDLDEYHRHCPRCATKIDYSKQSTTELTTDCHYDLAGEKEFNDLVKMLHNWSSGYIRSIERDGLDWSSPHEFFQEFCEQMVPYISRLKAMGYATEERMHRIGDELVLATRNIVDACEAEEELLRLTGRWTDDEQEIKDYWEERARKRGEIEYANLRIQM